MLSGMTRPGFFEDAALASDLLEFLSDVHTSPMSQNIVREYRARPPVRYGGLQARSSFFYVVGTLSVNMPPLLGLAEFSRVL